MKFETLYLRGNRCKDDLMDRVTDIIDIYQMEKSPNYNLACASCKFVLALKKEKYLFVYENNIFYGVINNTDVLWYLKKKENYA